MDSVISTVPGAVFLLGVMLCLLVGFYGVVAAPAINYFMAATVIGLGSTSIAGITYAKIVIAIQVISIVRVFLLPAAANKWQKEAFGRGRGGAKPKNPRADSGPPEQLRFPGDATAERKLQRTHRLAGWLLGLLLIVGLKILVESPFYGLTPDRIQELRIFALQVLLPSGLLLACSVKTSPDRLMRQLEIGAVAFSLAYLVPGVSWALRTGGLYSFRMSIYNLDPINGGRLLLLLLIAAGALSRWRSRWLGTSALALIPIAAGLLYLNNTRQYWLGAMVWAIGYSFLSKRRWVKGVTLISFVGLLLVVAGHGYYGEEDRLARVDSDSLQQEMVAGRGAIWGDVLATGLAHPLLGVGFGNYGEVYTVVTPDGELTTARSGAHGIAQDMMAEHGLFLFFGLFSLMGLLLWRFWRGGLKRYTERHSSVIFWSAMAIPCFLSGSMINATPVYGACIMFWSMTRSN